MAWPPASLDGARPVTAGDFSERLTCGRARTDFAECASQGCRDPDPGRSHQPAAQSAARQAPCRAQIHAGQVRLSRRPRGAARLANAGCQSARHECRTRADAAACSARAQREARAFALAAIRETFEETGLLLGARRADAPPVPEGPWCGFRESRISIPISRHCISSPAPSRRRGVRAASTLDSSRSMPARSRTASTMWCTRTPNWSSWSGCRSRRRVGSTCRPSPAWCWRNWKPRVAAGFGHDLPVPFYRMPRKRFTRELLSKSTWLFP